MLSLDELLQRKNLVVIYDGDCPFCGAYVKMLRLRESVGRVELVDARREPQIVSDCHGRGFDLNDGMLVLLGGRTYIGADAVSLLSQLTTASGVVNTAAAAVLKRPTLARVLYPAMRSGRAVTLKMLGRAKI